MKSKRPRLTTVKPRIGTLPDRLPALKAPSKRNRQTPDGRWLYGRRWQRARRVFLAEHPLCVHCQREGRVTPATDVDHIEPHRGDEALFWRPGNWQALCHECHSRKTAAECGFAGKGWA